MPNQGDGPAARRPESPTEPGDAGGAYDTAAPVWTTATEPDRTPDAPPGVASRVVTFVLGVIVGAVYGSVGTVAHPLTVTIGSVVFPYGLVIALIGVLALFIGFRLVVGGRLAAVGAAIGVVGIVSLFSLESVGGSILIREGIAGSVWLVGPALLGALVISWPSLPTRTHRLENPDVKETHTP